MGSDELMFSEVQAHNSVHATNRNNAFFIADVLLMIWL